MDTGLPEENLILRLFAPDESITKFEQIQTNPDGTFNYQLLNLAKPFILVLRMELTLLKY